MRILFIAMAESIHTARWINQIADMGWDIHLYPGSKTDRIHSDLRNITIHLPYHSFKLKSGKNYIKSKNIVFFKMTKIFKKIHVKIFSNYSKNRLEKIIKKLKPDIVHSLETQKSGYLVLKVKKIMEDSFPLWIHTNWGSDIYLFGRLKAHKPIIQDLLKHCDYYSCECHRDIDLAKKYGFSGRTLPVYPNTGGLDLNRIAKLKDDIGKPSSRKLILLKGYQGWAGRALVGIRAIARVKEFLDGYTIVLYSNTDSQDIIIASELLEQEVGIPVKLIPSNTKHEEILKLHGKARISIGLSISDAISTSLLETMAMGSFPIQSWTSCADEWIDDGVSGLLVPPEDPEIIEIAIKKALTDDRLVDDAEILNWEVVNKKLDYKDLKNKTIKIYEDILKEGRKDVKKT